MSNNIETNIKIADDCMAVIAGICATSVDGVVNLSSGLTKNVLPFMSSNNLKKGIEIKNENNNLNVFISLNVKQGYDVQNVCEKVQEKVKDGLESMLSMNVESVSVKVKGLLDKKDE